MHQLFASIHHELSPVCKSDVLFGTDVKNHTHVQQFSGL